MTPTPNTNSTSPTQGGPVDRDFPEPLPGTPAVFSLHDLSLVAGMIKRRAGRIIDEETAVGAYCRELERSVVELEDEVADWQRRWRIAVDERNRAERRVAELEGALDAVSSAVRKMRAA